ncbi:acyl carrier protein [Stenotrophomonas rhizophila]|uniref:Acyl carrier protein n=1 Tax=Stenotrophomonas rhizophila TaxID=216778 RepID=A0AAP5AG16_9GAMM|nr:phosphopantetheine-binding protein [Stenotrophomonas rhizophila]MDQ1107934.1 acyl carrier protein [Stenotrophomonas rhizophila]
MTSVLSLQDLRKLTAAHLGRPLEEIGSQQRLVEDLEIDSLEMHALLIQIEEAGAPLPDAEAMREVVTLADLYQAIAGPDALA